MLRIYVFGSGHRARSVLRWLEKDCDISSEEVSAIIAHPERPAALTDGLAVPVVAFDEIKDELDERDIVIVASERFSEALGQLLSHGICNVFDGNAVIGREAIAQRFLRAASHLYVGPNTPATLQPDADDYLRYSSAPIQAHNVPKHKLFVVNSLPKSGTVWMMAMLQALLGVDAERQITLSHVGDIEADWKKRNNHGAVTLVRDMRDVVVSWFHHLGRSDREVGFSGPRYPSMEEFYFEHFIGQIFDNPRYYGGDLERWLNFACAHGFPIVKYEDVIADAQAALRKIMNFWKIEVAGDAFREVARDYAFSNMQETLAGRSGYISDVLNAGHMRLGRPGSWKHELSDELVEDIDRRFSGYQRRLKYV